ncbi:MAG TPA: arginine--tRNA ligase, partial [Thermoanaerobaculia bacterium]
MLLETIIDELTTALQSRVLVLFGHSLERVVMQVPPRLAMGDLATPMALELARVLKKPPRQIAEAVVDGLQLPLLVKSVSVEGAGYINFRIDRGQFTAAYIRDVLARPAPVDEKVTVEHTNINPNKAAHIGHLRNAVLGDALVRCLKWLGYRVETQNYIDDTGVQVADVVVGFERILGDDLHAIRQKINDPSQRFDYDCWDLYSRTSASYESNPERKEWQQETLHKIERGEGETARIAAAVAEAIVRRHLATALRLDIEYDLLVKESDIIKERFWDRAFDLLKASGAVVYETSGKHKGCWVMRLSDSPEFQGLEEPDKILVRSNGTVTYTAKDIAYQMWKFGLLERTFRYREFLRYPDDRVLWETTHDANSDPAAPSFGGAKRVYNVIDTRQAYLQKIVREGLRLLGHARELENSIHFSYEMVALTPATATALGMTLSDEDAAKTYVEMSGRKGLGVKADDLMNELEKKAEEAIHQNVAGREEGDASSEARAEERLALAKQIAVGALRYFMLNFGRNKVIAFDFAQALTFEGDSGPYLQYATVRAENIFRKMRERNVDARLDEPSLDALTIGGEIADDLWEIVRMSAETAGVIRRAVEALELSLLTRHAFEIAQRFNSFYHKYPILNEKDEAERQRRAACAEIFRQSVHGILALLGIPIP